MSEVDENVDFTRKPLETIKPNLVSSKANRASRQSIGGDFIVDVSEVKRLKVVVQEKDKKVAFLEQQLLASQTQIEQLQTFSEKYKRQEREAKRALFHHESTARRQSVALKHVNDKLHGYVLKDEAKLRRSNMEKKELEEELYRVEESFEQQLATAYETLHNERSEYDEEIKKKDSHHAAQTQQLTELYQGRIGDQAEEYSSQLVQFSDIISQLETKSSELAIENRLLASRSEDREKELQSITQLCESLKQELSSAKTSNATFAKQLKRRSDDLSTEIARSQQLAHTIETLQGRLRHSIESDTEKDASLVETTQSSEYLVQLLRSEIVSKDDQIQHLLGDLKHTKEDAMLQNNSITALTNELRILKDAHGTLKSLCDKFKSQLDVTRGELSATRLTQQQAASQAVALGAELVKSKGKGAELESILGNITEELKLKTTEANDLIATRDTLTDQLNHLDELYHKACAEAQEQSLAVQRVNKEAQEQSLAVQRVNKEITDLTLSLHQTQQDHAAALAEEKNKYETTSAELKSFLELREQDKIVMEAFRNRLRDTQQFLNASQSENSELKTSNAALRTQLEAVNQELVAAHERISSLNSNISVLSATQTLSQDEIVRLSARLDETQRSESSLEAQCASLQQTLVEKGLELTALSTSYGSLQQQLVEKGLELTALSTSYESQQQQLVEKGLEFTALSTSYGSLQQQSEQQKEHINELLAVKELLTAEATVLSSSLVEMKGVKENLSSLLQESQARSASVVSDFTALQSEKQAVEEANARLEATLCDIDKEITELALANKTATELALEKDTQLEQYCSEIFTLTAQLNTATEALASSEAKRSEIENESSSLQSELARVQSSLSDAQRDAEALNSQLSAANAQFVEQVGLLESEVNQSQMAISRLTESLESTQRDLVALTLRAETVESECVSLKSQYAAAVEHLTAVTTQHEVAETDLSYFKNQVEDLTRQVEQLQLLVDTADERVLAERLAQVDAIAALEHQIEEERCKIGEFAQTLTAKDDEIKAMQANLAAAEDKYQELKQQGRSQEDIESLALMGFLPDETIQTLCNKLKSLQTENSKLSLENANLLGHANSKQKIHYVTDLKKQINELLEDNQRLRDLLRNATIAATTGSGSSSSGVSVQAAALQFRGGVSTSTSSSRNKETSRESILPTGKKLM